MVERWKPEKVQSSISTSTYFWISTPFTETPSISAESRGAVAMVVGSKLPTKSSPWMRNSGTKRPFSPPKWL